jgi:siroheme synthase
VLITTGHTKDHASADLAAYRPGQTLALYMGVARFGSVAAELVANGHDPATPIAIVERGTTDEQRVVLGTLADLGRLATEQAIASPALLLVGETVRYAQRYSWFHPGRLVVPPQADEARLACAAEPLNEKRKTHP